MRPLEIRESVAVLGNRSRGYSAALEAKSAAAHRVRHEDAQVAYFEEIRPETAARPMGTRIQPSREWILA